MARSKRKVTGSGRDPSRKRGSNSETGVFRSIRNGGEHVFESGAEKRNLMVLDVSPDVLSFEVQPETIDLGGRRSYTPDTLVRTVDGSRYQEVKPRRILARDPTLSERLDRIVEEAADRGAGFEIVSEDVWGARALSYNANILRHSARRPLPAARARAMELMASRREGMTLVELVRGLRMGIIGKFAVLGLVALGKLRMDLEREIGPDSLVRLPEAA